MDYNITKQEYYADFVVFPMLMVLAACVGLDLRALFAVPVGFVAWTLVEYWMHRVVLHRLTRREHWVHHIRPSAFVGVHPAVTGGIGLTALVGAWGTFGVALGGALFCGVALGYVAYIALHDAIHHGQVADLGPHLRRRAWCHRVHHESGKEVNFGVTTGFWDGVMGTYWEPGWGGEISGRRVLTL